MEKRTLEDTSLVAYLALQGHQFKPAKREDGRIVFEILDDFSLDLEALYTNPHVPILSYIQQLKTIRSSLFALKAGGGK